MAAGSGAMTSPDGPGYQPPPGAPPPPSDDSPFQTVDVAKRLGNTVRALLSLHVETFQEEARGEVTRALLLGGALGTAAALSFAIVLNLAVLLVLVVERITGLPMLESALIGLGFYVLGAITALLAALWVLRWPFLPKTRTLVGRTWASLTKDNPESEGPQRPAPSE